MMIREAQVIPRIRNVHVRAQQRRRRLQSHNRFSVTPVLDEVLPILQGTRSRRPATRYEPDHKNRQQ